MFIDMAGFSTATEGVAEFAQQLAGARKAHAAGDWDGSHVAASK